MAASEEIFELEDTYGAHKYDEDGFSFPIS